MDFLFYIKRKKMMIKLFVFLLIFAILFVCREGFFLFKCLHTTQPFITTKARLISLGISIAYIITILITGI